MGEVKRILKNANGRTSINVMVVDDSAVVRQIVSDILSQEGMYVETASDPLIALKKMTHVSPDVIVLDMEMPNMDGLTFLRKLMAENPIPVVVCSGLAGPGTEIAMKAMEEGAIDIIAKPKLAVRNFLFESAILLVDSVRAAAKAHPNSRRKLQRYESQQAQAAVKKEMVDAAIPAIQVTTDQVVAVGASTGGTEALRVILEALPVDAPGLVVVQHMPANFTKAFADRLNESCKIEVKEAEEGDRILQGRALIAPGDRHMIARRSGAHYIVSLDDGPLVSRHRPSVDVLFHSVAQAAGPNAIGVIMTGMGRDGAEGIFAMRKAGAATLAQDEASCVVFGMPKEAIQLGAIQEVTPLYRLASMIVRNAANRPLKAQRARGG